MPDPFAFLRALSKRRVLFNFEFGPFGFVNFLVFGHAVRKGAIPGEGASLQLFNDIVDFELTATGIIDLLVQIHVLLSLSKRHAPSAPLLLRSLRRLLGLEIGLQVPFTAIARSLIMLSYRLFQIIKAIGGRKRPDKVIIIYHFAPCFF